MHENEKRQLAAILFADIAGYTAMVQENEDNALQKVTIFREALEKATGHYDGEIIQYYGDGCLATYGSAVSAVKCAIEMQHTYLEHDVPVRIGLHYGDIVFKDGTVYGDGVNVASRIESHGTPGAILISSKLQEEVVNHPEIKTRPLGSYSLKNVSAPVKLFALIDDKLVTPRSKASIDLFGQRTLQWVLFLMITVMAGYYAYTSLFKNNSVNYTDIKAELLAISFHDYANLPGKEELSAMTSVWLGNRLSEIGDTRVVRYEQTKELPDMNMATVGRSNLASYTQKTGAVNLLEGSIFRVDDSLQFEAAIYELENGEELYRFKPVKGPINDPMQGINSVANEVLGWWASKGEPIYSVPNYDAFEAYIQARKSWKTDYDRSEEMLNRSIALDSTFIDPHFLLLELYYNQDRFAERWAEMQLIRQKFSKLSPRQEQVLEAFQADHEGDLRKAYTLFKKEIEENPKDLFTNTSGMALALGYIGDEETTLEYFEEIPVDSLDLDNCLYCRTRLHFAIRALLNQGKLKRAAEIAEYLPLERDFYRDWFYKIAVHIRQGNDTPAMDLLTEAIRDTVDEIGRLISHTAREFALMNNKPMLDEISAIATELSRDGRLDRGYLVEVLHTAGKDQEALDSFRILLEGSPGHPWVVYHAALLYASNGETRESDRWSDKLKVNAEEPYDYGQTAYHMAVLSAVKGDNARALDLLSSAWESGHVFWNYNYQNDPDLAPLFDDKRFREIINPGLN